MSYAILIPARLGSTRLPEKVLLVESGKPLIQHVVEAAQRARGATCVWVCTDSARVADAVRGFGATAVMTRSDHVSGTDRCAEAALALDVDVVVNLQGDEPFVDAGDIEALAAAAAVPGTDIATLATPFESPDHRADPSAVKALREPDGFARTFQRADPDTSEGDTSGGQGLEVLHHLGLYAFPAARLQAFSGMPPSAGERRERLEQLRALDAGWRIRVLDASAPAFGIDTPADYARFLARLREI